MTRTLLLIATIGIFLACKSSEKTIDDLVIDRNVDKSKIYAVRGNCIFIIQLSDMESDSLESIDPDSYEIYSENANNDASRINELLETQKIKSIWSDKRYIVCNWNNADYLLDTRSLDVTKNYCILFNKSKKPKLVLGELLDKAVLIKYYK